MFLHLIQSHQSQLLRSRFQTNRSPGNLELLCSIAVHCFIPLFQIFYPINQTEIGSGVAHNVHFRPHSLTNWTFPFAINYTTTLDPNRLILVDLAEKCGVTGQKSNLSVSYKIKVTSMEIPGDGSQGH